MAWYANFLALGGQASEAADVAPRRSPRPCGQERRGACECDDQSRARARSRRRPEWSRPDSRGPRARTPARLSCSADQGLCERARGRGGLPGSCRCGRPVSRCARALRGAASHWPARRRHPVVRTFAPRSRAPGRGRAAARDGAAREPRRRDARRCAQRARHGPAGRRGSRALLDRALAAVEGAPDGFRESLVRVARADVAWLKADEAAGRAESEAGLLSTPRGVRRGSPATWPCGAPVAAPTRWRTFILASPSRSSLPAPDERLPAPGGRSAARTPQRSPPCPATMRRRGKRFAARSDGCRRRCACVRPRAHGPRSAGAARAATIDPSGPYGLTEREREVLELLIAGPRNAEIAAALHSPEDGRPPRLGLPSKAQREHTHRGGRNLGRCQPKMGRPPDAAQPPPA